MTKTSKPAPKATRKAPKAAKVVQAIVAALTLSPEVSPDIAGLRVSCSSTGCGSADMVADKSGKYSRGQQCYQIACALDWAITLAFNKTITGKVAALFTSIGATVKDASVTITGQGHLSKAFRDALQQASTVGVVPGVMFTYVDGQALGYQGLRNLSASLQGSAPVNTLWGLTHSLTAEDTATFNSYGTLASVPEVKRTLPQSVGFASTPNKPAQVVALHRLIMAYTGRAGFSKDPVNVKRDSDTASVKRHLNGSQGWLRIFKNDTIKGDGLAHDMLQSMAHKSLNPTA